MILFWKDKNFAVHRELGSSILGITHKSTRPDVVILTKKEHDKLINNQDCVLNKKGEVYLHTLSLVTSTPNVIVAS